MSQTRSENVSADLDTDDVRGGEEDITVLAERISRQAQAKDELKRKADEDVARLQKENRDQKKALDCAYLKIGYNGGKAQKRLEALDDARFKLTAQLGVIDAARTLMGLGGDVGWQEYMRVADELRQALKENDGLAPIVVEIADA